MTGWLIFNVIPEYRGKFIHLATNYFFRNLIGSFSLCNASIEYVVSNIILVLTQLKRYDNAVSDTDSTGHV